MAAGSRLLETAPALGPRERSEFRLRDRRAHDRRTREDTKQAQLIGMLEKGATIEEIAAATVCQPHTVRGACAGALKKRLGLTINSEKVEGRGRVYRIER